MRRCSIVLSAAVLLNSVSLTWAQHRIEHKRPDFAITIPSAFKPVEDPDGQTSFLLFMAAGSDGNLAIRVSDLGGRIGLEKLKASDLPEPGASSPQLQIEYLPRRGIELSVIVGRVNPETSPPTVPVIWMGAQIPLRERGIVLYVSGPSSREHEVRALLRTLLDSFEGGLVSPDSPRERVGTVNRLSGRERFIQLSWSLCLSVGWLSLLAYLFLRLVLIGRRHALVSLRVNWLALSGLCITVGSVIRVMASRDPEDRSVNTLFALISLLVAFLVLRARGRLIRVKREQLSSTVTGCSSPSE